MCFFFITYFTSLGSVLCIIFIGTHIHSSINRDRQNTIMPSKRQNCNKTDFVFKFWVYMQSERTSVSLPLSSNKTFEISSFWLKQCVKQERKKYVNITATPRCSNHHVHWCKSLNLPKQTEQWEKEKKNEKKNEAIAAFQNENNELRIFETVIKFAFASHSMQEKTKRFFSCLHTACVYRSVYTYMCFVALRGDSVISS